MLNGLKVVLVHTRFPENIGMAARACANMGCNEICLVSPARWNIQKAIPLATAKGLPLLERIIIYEELQDAIKGCHLVVGTTARIGGWRKNTLNPEQAAKECLAGNVGANLLAIIFGPEDRGLCNEEIQLCNMLVNIPTAQGASSLNLAQAVLLILYEFNRIAKSKEACGNGHGFAPKSGKLVNSEEFSRMMSNLKDMLSNIDYLHGDNPDYFMLAWQNMLSRARLRRYEYDVIMGMCRQIKNKCKKR